MDNLPDSLTNLLSRLSVSPTAGDWDRLIKNYWPIVYQSIRCWIWNKECVDDAAQEAFLAIRKALPRFRPRGEGESLAWLLTVAKRRAKDYALKERRHMGKSIKLHESIDDLEAVSRSEVELAGEKTAVVWDALAKLSDSQRLPLMLHYLQGMDYGRLGRALGIEAETAKKRVQRALDVLRQRVLASGIVLAPFTLVGNLSAMGSEPIPPPPNIPPPLRPVRYAKFLYPGLIVAISGAFLALLIFADGERSRPTGGGDWVNNLQDRGSPENGDDPFFPCARAWWSGGQLYELDQFTRKWDVALDKNYIDIRAAESRLDDGGHVLIQDYSINLSGLIAQSWSGWPDPFIREMELTGIECIVDLDLSSEGELLWTSLVPLRESTLYDQERSALQMAARNQENKWANDFLKPLPNGGVRFSVHFLRIGEKNGVSLLAMIHGQTNKFSPNAEIYDGFPNYDFNISSSGTRIKGISHVSIIQRQYGVK